MRTAFRYFILDLDGTLFNGKTPIPGVADSVHALLTDTEKRVLFFTNGGYASLTYTYDTVVQWLTAELSAEKFA